MMVYLSSPGDDRLQFKCLKKQIEDKLIFKTKIGENPEGFSLMNDNLYYAYGWEKTTINGTIAGSVTRKYKKFQFRKLDLESYISSQISKTTYLSIKKDELTNLGLPGILKAIEMSQKTEKLNVDPQLKSKAENLLKIYGLHPIGKAEDCRMSLVDNYELIRYNSEKIGLNLSGYRGKEVDALVFTLQEKSQRQGKIHALILLDKDIIGACLLMEGCSSEVTALNEKFNFMPDGLSNQSLQLTDINKIEIYGPWDQKESLIREVILSDETEIKSFLAMINNSVPIAENQNNSLASIAKYKLGFFYYKEYIVHGSLFIGQDATKLSLEPLSSTEFSCPNKLKTYIEHTFKESKNHI